MSTPLKATIRHQDEHLLVVEKPPRMVTQPGRGHESGSLLDHLMEGFGPALRRLGASRDFGLLHRLDRTTSGLLVVALTAEAYDALREAFEAREIRKFYWAVTAPAPSKDSGVIRRPILETQRDVHGKEMKIGIISSRGKAAVTALRVLARSATGGLVECRAVTGRLHQIRVHLESIGAPIAGDEIYAPEPVRRLAPRLALHAHRLSFVHPIAKQPIDVRSPWPGDLKGTLTQLKLPKPESVSAGGAQEPHEL